jgi:hypothetical protein
MPVRKVTPSKTTKEVPRQSTKPKINTLIGFEHFVEKTKSKVNAKLEELTRTGRTDSRLMQLATNKIIRTEIQKSGWI